MDVNLLVPGHGQESRTATLRRTVDSVRPATCVVYAYNRTTFWHPSCTVELVKGGLHLWTHFMQRYVVPSNGLDVLLAMDDIVAPVAPLPRPAAFDAVSAAIHGWHWRVMRPKVPPPRQLRATAYVDMLFVRFLPRAWRCWVGQIDTRVNKYGWGYDRTFQKACEVRLAINDSVVARHRPHTGQTYDHSASRKEEKAWLRHFRALKSKGRHPHSP